MDTTQNFLDLCFKFNRLCTLFKSFIEKIKTKKEHEHVKAKQNNYCTKTSSSKYIVKFCLRFLIKIYRSYYPRT